MNIQGHLKKLWNIGALLSNETKRATYVTTAIKERVILTFS